MPAILHHFGRLSLIIAASMLVTLSLFFAMQYLISSKFERPDTAVAFRIADITEPDLVIDVMKKQPRPEKPDEPDELPEIASPDLPQFGVNPTGIGIPTPAIAELVSPDNFGISNANAVPLVQVQAVYPTRALQREIEGYIVVEFDVDETGQVINPRVLFEEPEGYFQNAAFKALERYRYQPKIVNGKEVKMLGVQQKISFTLQD